MGELHSGFDLVDGDDIYLDLALAADHTWTGITCYGGAGEDLVLGELVYLFSDATWLKTDADAAATTDGVLALVTEDIANGNYGRFLLMGFFRDDSWDTLTTGGWMYVHTTAGDMSQTAPSASGDQVRKVGVAVSAVIVWFNPDSTIVEVS